MTNPDDVKNLIESAGGRVESAMLLPDGHGCMTASFPLPADHWLTADGFAVPPMGLRCGTREAISVRGVTLSRSQIEAIVREAAKYAVRASTRNGKDDDFDPDAMVQNFLIGLIGYYTPNGLSSSEWSNPPQADDAVAGTDE